VQEIVTGTLCCGSGNFVPDPDMDPKLEILDPDSAQDPKQDINLNKNHQKSEQFNTFRR
jgi:hypothetical protein